MFKKIFSCVNCWVCVFVCVTWCWTERDNFSQITCLNVDKNQYRLAALGCRTLKQKALGGAEWYPSGCHSDQLKLETSNAVEESEATSTFRRLLLIANIYLAPPTHQIFLKHLHYLISSLTCKRQVLVLPLFHFTDEKTVQSFIEYFPRAKLSKFT